MAFTHWRKNMASDLGLAATWSGLCRRLRTRWSATSWSGSQKWTADVRHGTEGGGHYARRRLTLVDPIDQDDADECMMRGNEVTVPRWMFYLTSSFLITLFVAVFAII